MILLFPFFPYFLKLLMLEIDDLPLKIGQG